MRVSTPFHRLMKKTFRQNSDSGVNSYKVLEAMNSNFVKDTPSRKILGPNGEEYFRVGESIIGGPDIVK